MASGKLAAPGYAQRTTIQLADGQRAIESESPMAASGWLMLVTALVLVAILVYLKVPYRRRRTK